MASSDPTGAPRAILRRGDAWLVFGCPRRELSAASVGEVPDLLRRLEEAVAGGHWAVGYLAYEAAPAFDEAYEAHPPSAELPVAWWGLFDRPATSSELPPGASDGCDGPELSWRPSLGREAHGRVVEEVRRLIERGDTYQVNLTLALEASVPSPAPSSLELFRRLVSWSPPPHAAFLDLGEGRAVLSASPELFFRVIPDDDGGTVLTRPMKGTTPRGRHPREDEARREALLSEKNRAENLMIADMMRNDLGRVSRPGSVRVRRLFGVETYPTVHQLVTEVEGRLEAGRSAFDVLRALFPSASITGAPKARTTSLIRRLEPAPRGVYTGSVGAFEPGGAAELNVAIRTLSLTGEGARYGTGGGIVWDSRPDDEYDEALTKSLALRSLDRPWEPFRLLETLLWRPRRSGGRFFLLDRHLDRQEASARYFGFAYDRAALEARLAELDERWRRDGGGRSRVRILVAADGEVEIERHDAPCPGRVVCSVRLDDRPVDENDPFLFHKTTRRDVYEAAASRHPDADEVILWNSRGELTEATRANLVLRRGDRWLTPPLDAGLLAGTYRAAGLERGRFEEETLHAEDLEDADGIFLINSVQGWRRCRLGGTSRGPKPSPFGHT